MNEIPPITNPLGRSWEQPKRENVLIDDTHALMSEADFKQLLDYSCSLPSGVYFGKMWKRRKNYYDPAKGWMLGFYAECDEPGFCSTNWREIIICEP